MVIGTEAKAFNNEADGVWCLRTIKHVTVVIPVKNRPWSVFDEYHAWYIVLQHILFLVQSQLEQSFELSLTPNRWRT